MTYKSILCLNGDLPPRDFFEKQNLPIVAADGAANALVAMGVHPIIVIGDLDSVHPHLGLNLLQVIDQSRCDFEKSMEYLEQNDLLPTIVVGSSGGELDHILNNMSVFMSYPPGNLLYAPPLYGMILNQPQTHLQLPIHTKVSIFALPKARLETQGLEWNLTGETLHFPVLNSSLNRTIAPQITIRILEGQILFLAHDFLPAASSGDT